MKKLINFSLFFLLTFFYMQQAAAVNVSDYTDLNNAVLSAAANPSVNDIDFLPDTLTLGGNTSVISNKTINFRSMSPSAATVIDGANLYKGFTANSGSALTFTNIQFQNSMAMGGNGGFLGLNSSSASFTTETTFTNGYALYGGAVSAENNSYLHFADDVVFNANRAVDHGGGFYSRMSTVVFDADASFTDNVSEYTGGGFHADTGSNITFNGNAYFGNNSSIDNNGAGFYAYRSTVTFVSASFENNESHDIGGGFYSSLSHIIFSDTATFTGNSARYSGGGLSSGYSSDIEFFGKVFFSSNTAGAEGGAIDGASSTIMFYDDAEFSGNISGTNGGAIFVEENSYLQFDGSALFEGNKAGSYGGALGIQRSNAVFNSDSRFENNSAGSGGALYIYSGNISLNDAVFDGNTADSEGGAVYVRGTETAKGSLTVNTSNETIFQNNKAAGESNALFLDSFSFAEFDTAAGASVQMYDAIAGSGYDSTLIVSGAGIFNLYNKISDVDITLSATAGSAFNLMSGAEIDAGKLTIGNGSRFDSTNNSADTIKVKGIDIYGTLAMEVSDSGIHDQIVSSGDVNLGATSSLEVTTDITDTNFRKKTYRLINTPESINGIFGTVAVMNPALLNSPVVNYGDVFEDWITLTILGDNLTTDFASSIAGLTFNQRQTAKTYDALSTTSTGDLDAIISFIEGMDESEQRKALAQASGYFLANVIRSAAVDAENNEIYDRIKNHCLYGNSESGVWAQLRGAATTYSKDNNSLNDFNDTSSGIMLGFDRFIEESGIMLGAYGKYNTHSIDQGSSDADITNTGAGIYGGIIEDEWEVKALVSGTYDNYSTKRYIRFADRKANADFDGTTFGADIEAAYKYKFEENISLRPYLGLEAKNSHYNGFNEKGAESLSLKVSGDSYVRSAARIGAGAVYDNNIFDWYFNAEAKYLMSGRSPEIESAFEGSDIMFKSRGSEEGSIIFGAIAGAAVRITRELKVFVNGSYYGGDHFKNLYANIGLRWNFCDPLKEKKPKPVKEPKVKKSRSDDYDPAKYLLALVPEEPKEMDAIITFEEIPVNSSLEEEYDAALELLKASEEQQQEQPQEEDDGYDAALELLNQEIKIDDTQAQQKQQKEAELRRSKPLLKSFSLNMANFATGKSVLTEKAKENIRLQAAEIKNFNYEKITIEGHTDSTGSAAVNKRLSRERAKAVFDVFVEEGIPAKKMSYIGFSSLLPVAANNTIEGRAQNRRVEIFVE